MPKTFSYPAVIVSVHDGDTVTLDVQISPALRMAADLDLGFYLHGRPDGLWFVRQAVRLHGIDAPELATASGKLAAAHLKTIARPGTRAAFTSRGRDKYGRLLGDVAIAGNDLAAAMIAARHAKAWSGTGPKPVAFSLAAVPDAPAFDYGETTGLRDTVAFGVAFALLVAVMGLAAAAAYGLHLLGVGP